MRRTSRIARTGGFTVAELVIAIAIILIVAALLQPVLVRASNHAKEVKCQSNLRQLHAAISMYRQDYDGEGIYGEVAAMGLPPGALELYGSFVSSLHVFRCSMGMTGDRVGAFHWLYPGPPGVPRPDQQIPRWPEYVQQFREDAIIIIDLNHDTEGRGIRSPYLYHRGIGLYLGGHVTTRVKQGDPTERMWWND